MVRALIKENMAITGSNTIYTYISILSAPVVYVTVMNEVVCGWYNMIYQASLLEGC